MFWLTCYTYGHCMAERSCVFVNLSPWEFFKIFMKKWIEKLYHVLFMLTQVSSMDSLAVTPSETPGSRWTSSWTSKGLLLCKLWPGTPVIPVAELVLRRVSMDNQPWSECIPRKSRVPSISRFGEIRLATRKAVSTTWFVPFRPDFFTSFFNSRSSFSFRAYMHDKLKEFLVWWVFFPLSFIFLMSQEVLKWRRGVSSGLKCIFN